MKRTIVPIGPYHPLLEEPEHFKLYVEGERVVDVDVEIGYNHRGIEKLAEGKTWDQVPFLVERICGICSTSHPLAYCLAVEDLVDCKVPERAALIRVVIAELERIHSHLLWVGLAGHFIGYNTVWMWAWKYREAILEICEKLTGNRNHYAMIKPGGVRRDLNDEQIEYALKRIGELAAPTNMLIGAVSDDPVMGKRLRGVGVLPYEDAVLYSALGPTSRGSGVPWDTRKDESLAGYKDLDWKVIVQQDGDVFAKAVVRLLECLESVSLIGQALTRMEEGPIDAEITEVPPGEGCGRYEAPRGEVFHYVRSDGSNMPYRVKVRAPTFNNLPTFKVSCKGETIADVALITASIDPCYCCTERVGVVDRNGNEKTLREKDLVGLSVEKTKKIINKMGRIPTLYEKGI
ncbi:nickel-dependent hydrogenase large subunit [candidate division WOR-3 bacterium]|nr:nickel-dependent hydrogenase large subunit [candidate division WOR-3 bacterium]